MAPDVRDYSEVFFDVFPSSIMAVNNEYQILAANRKALAVLGYSSEGEIPRGEFLSVIAEPSLDQIRDSFMKAVRGETVENSESGFRKKDGSLLTCEYSISPLPDAGSGITGVIVVFHDISDRKRADLALFRANRMLNSLNSITRHDILNQLTILLGYLELSKDMITDPTLKEFASREEGAAELIRRQISFTKGYQDIGTRPPGWLDIRLLVEEAIELIEHGAIKISDNLPEGLFIFADPLIRKVITSLIENTLRHGAHAKTLNIFLEKAKSGLVLVFADDGPGIAADQKEKIFQRAVGMEGGYGLFLSRELLAVTGMAIRETGEPGKGARFEILVPDGSYIRQ